MNDLSSLTATEAVNEIAARKIKAVEYVSACLRQIRRREPEIHAWVCLDENSALNQAGEIDQRINRAKAIGRLAGIPVGVKDIFNTADFPTEMGSPIWKNFTPGNDARVVSYLKWEGTVIPGKTVTAEFAVHTPGPTHNPYKHGYMTGTSSSGSAAAVAAGMIPLSLGTQTAGSTIRPASYCGVFAMKPSFGLIPRTGMLKTTDTLDTIGFFSRSADDLKLMLEVLRVKGDDYPISNQALLRSQNHAAKFTTWKIGLVTDSLWTWEKAENYAKTAIKKFAEKLSQDPRIKIEILDLPVIFNSVHRLHQTIYNKTLAYYFQNEHRQKKLVSEIMRRLIEDGTKINLSEYQNSLAKQEKISSVLEKILEKHGLDAILTLSTGGEALRGLDSVDRPDSCLIWTFCHAPVINLPAFRGPLNLPFGAQIVSGKYDDYRLLALAQYLENNQYISYSPPTIQ